MKFIVYNHGKGRNLAFCREELYPQMMRTHYPTFVVAVFNADNFKSAEVKFNTTDWLAGRAEDSD